tara:strand:- start:4399 stop:4956 length:558 start_codon:yes stop_codon:yes gene_type:complete
VITVLDIETTMDFEKSVSSPYSGQQIVFVGYQSFVEDYSTIINGEYFFYHNQCEPTPDGAKHLQERLDDTTCLVGHNLKFDLQWLRECGFIYNKALWDTMIAEYLCARGIKQSISLAECAKRRGLPEKRTDLTEKYIKDKISYEDMPPDIVKEYCLADVRTTARLAQSQLDELQMSFPNSAVTTR